MGFVSFVQMCVNYEARPEEIDDYVERWHTSPELGVSLSEFLGLSDQEYGKWLLDASVLEKVIANRRGIS